MIINIVRRDAQDNPCWYRSNAVYTYNELGERVLASQAIEGATLQDVVSKVQKAEIAFQYIAVR